MGDGVECLSAFLRGLWDTAVGRCVVDVRNARPAMGIVMSFL